MIINFSNFINENINNDFNIGDYVILKDIFAMKNDEQPSIWHNSYAIIINEGYFEGANFNKDGKYYLLHHLNKLSNEYKNFLDKSNDAAVYITPINNIKKDKYDVWVHPDYLVKYETKEEFDDAIEHIEIEKSTKKYNL